VTVIEELHRKWWSDVITKLIAITFIHLLILSNCPIVL